MSIEINGISKTFDSFKALGEIDLKIETGELVALLGPSGSGKTTLLRIIAGLETAGAGKIKISGQDTTRLNAKERNVGFVFQHYALFKHMTVSDNIAFGLKVRPKRQRPSEREIKEKVLELLSLIKMDGFADRYPSQLSGGQRQRVALARALAVEPKVLLLDEPFGALDAKVRKDLRRWLRKLHDEYSVTSVFVTHDQEEALDVADRIVILKQGVIEQVGTPEEVYDNPVNPFVYNFMGNVNLFYRRKETGESIANYSRPHDIEIQRERFNNEFSQAKVVFIRAIGPSVKIELECVDNLNYIEAEIGREAYEKLCLKENELVYIRPKDFKEFTPDHYII